MCGFSVVRLLAEGEDEGGKEASFERMSAERETETVGEYYIVLCESDKRSTRMCV